MAKKLYTKKECKGKCTIINKDEENFAWLTKLNSTASMELTEENDKIFLFKKTKWDGDTLFRSGKRTITDLGDASDGGKKSFRNSINSIRVSCFDIRVKYHIVKSSKGEFPGGFSSNATMESNINKMHILASNIWEEVLLRLDNVGFAYHTNDDYFDLSDESKCKNVDFNKDFNIPQQFAHVFVVDKSFALGCALPRRSSRAFHINARNDNNLMKGARTLAHELGHSLGLSHGGNSNKDRLMTQTGSSAPVYGTNLSFAEVERVHDSLSDKKGDDRLYRIE